MYTFLFITNNNKSIENNNAMSIIKLKRRESMRNRITILKEKMLDEKRYASIEQARIITRIYKENETQKLFSNFRQSHWELCNTQRRIELLQELADFEARENLHIPEVKVYGETLPETIGEIRIR